MPAKDQFHDIVKNALIKDGWTVTDDPLYLELGDIAMYVDLGGTKIGSGLEVVMTAKKLS